MMNVAIPKHAVANRGRRPKRLQTKHLPDEPVLLTLLDIHRRLGRPEEGVTVSATIFPGFEHSVSSAFPPGLPWKLQLAKMASMIRRGLVDGCACGCRGDFMLTAKGLWTLRALRPELFPIEYVFRGVLNLPVHRRTAGRCITVKAGNPLEAALFAYLEAAKTGDVVVGIAPKVEQAVWGFFSGGIPKALTRDGVVRYCW